MTNKNYQSQVGRLPLFEICNIHGSQLRISTLPWSRWLTMVSPDVQISFSNSLRRVTYDIKEGQHLVKIRQVSESELRAPSRNTGSSILSFKIINLIQIFKWDRLLLVFYYTTWYSPLARNTGFRFVLVFLACHESFDVWCKIFRAVFDNVSFFISHRSIRVCWQVVCCRGANGLLKRSGAGAFIIIGKRQNGFHILRKEKKTNKITKSCWI